jgi:hypothetical protein
MSDDDERVIDTDRSDKSKSTLATNVADDADTDSTRDVESTSKPLHQCEGCLLPVGTWRFYIRRFLCEPCTKSEQFKTIARSEAMKRFNLTWQELFDAGRYGLIQCFKVPNPHARRATKAQRRFIAPMNLYLVGQVKIFEKQLRSGLINMEYAKAEYERVQRRRQMA